MRVCPSHLDHPMCCGVAGRLCPVPPWLEASNHTIQFVHVPLPVSLRTSAVARASLRVSLALAAPICGCASICALAHHTLTTLYVLAHELMRASLCPGRPRLPAYPQVRATPSGPLPCAYAVSGHASTTLAGALAGALARALAGALVPEAWIQTHRPSTSSPSPDGPMFGATG